MKKAFTMIELIFVIVILGILAAVALPKFIGVAGQAHEANLKSFVGTLNRSVGPTLWSKSISEGKHGSINYLDLEYDSSKTDNNLTTYVDVPKEIKDVKIKNLTTTGFKVVAKADSAVAGGDYYIACEDGNASQAPVCHTYKGSKNLGDNADSTQQID